MLSPPLGFSHSLSFFFSHSSKFQKFTKLVLTQKHFLRESFSYRLRVPWCRGCFLICNFGLAVSALSLPNQHLRDLVSVWDSFLLSRPDVTAPTKPLHLTLFNSLSTRPPSPACHHLSLTHRMSNMHHPTGLYHSNPWHGLTLVQSCRAGQSHTCVLVVHRNEFTVKRRVTRFISA